MCAERRYAPRFAKDGFAVVRCSACGLEYINPQPSDAELSAIYDILARSILPTSASGVGLSPVKYEAELGVLLEHTGSRRGRLLEVGCATGSFLRVAREQGFDVRGIELSGPSVKVARERFGLEVTQGDFASPSSPPRASTSS